MSETEAFYTSGPTKRMASEDIDMEASHKRPRNQGQRNLEVRFLLQSKNAGAIIGKSGSNINRLRQDYKASVTVPDCPGPERILSIGIDVESLPDILMDIIPKLEEYGNSDSKDSKCEMRMLLHQGHAGCIIGKGGIQIKQLREKTGAHIKVYTNCCPSSTERVCQVTGDLKVIVNSITEIVDLISQAPIKGQSILYDPHNYDSLYANDYGGHSDGSNRGGNQMGGGRWAPFPSRVGPLRGGNMPLRVPAPPPFMGSGSNRSPPNSRHSGGGLPPPGVRSWTPSGRPSIDSRSSNWRGNNLRDGGQFSGDLFYNGSEYRSSGRSNSYPFSTTRFPFSKPPTADNFSFNNLATPPTSTSSTMGDSIYSQPPLQESKPHVGSLFSSKPVLNGDKQSSTSQVTIPNELAGAIIGKGGQRIRKIRRDSGAGITIDEPQPGSSDRVITISGSPQQIHMAQYLLQENVREHSGRKF